MKTANVLNIPEKTLEEVTEENYFFKLSKYQKQIKELIEKDKLKIYPEFRKNEVLGFLKEGLQDISISEAIKGQKTGELKFQTTIRKKCMFGLTL